ncbi:hypothetical protein OSTOST_01598 [Ostertagia ostertagi]
MPRVVLWFEVRAALESIQYRGGSTLTAQAVDLSVDDLLRGRRPNAIQVCFYLGSVLMNDGFSQDAWDRVLSASERLTSVKAELFGVALGSEYDPRELERYIGRNDRIYRDGSTENPLDCYEHTLNGFFNAMLFSLPSSGKVLVLESEAHRESHNPQRQSDECAGPGSLKSGARVRVSVISFGDTPKVTLDFTDISERDKIFAQTELFDGVAIAWPQVLTFSSLFEQKIPPIVRGIS